LRNVALILVLVVAATVSGEGQRRGGGGRGGGFGVRPAVPEDFDGSWQFCRVAFRPNRNGDGAGWSVDYPRADINLSIRLSELTKTTVGFDAPDEPKHVVIRLTDPTLFQCPFIMMTEVGAAFIADDEAEALRTYLLKGGFLWADDFWGEYAFDHWMNELRKALPSGEYPLTDMPLDHPIFHVLYDVKEYAQIPSINFWYGTNGGTSERGRDSATPHVRAVSDHDGRVLVVMTHNSDFGDAFEREGDSREYFERFAGAGYAFGVNTLLYSMTH